jgi:hypothetical protein
VISVHGDICTYYLGTLGVDVRTVHTYIFGENPESFNAHEMAGINSVTLGERDSLSSDLKL